MLHTPFSRKPPHFGNGQIVWLEQFGIAQLENGCLFQWSGYHFQQSLLEANILPLPASLVPLSAIQVGQSHTEYLYTWELTPL